MVKTGIERRRRLLEDHARSGRRAPARIARSGSARRSLRRRGGSRRAVIRARRRHQPQHGERGHASCPSPTPPPGPRSRRGRRRSDTAAHHRRPGRPPDREGDGRGPAISSRGVTSRRATSWLQPAQRAGPRRSRWPPCRRRPADDRRRRRRCRGGPSADGRRRTARGRRRRCWPPPQRPAEFLRSAWVPFISSQELGPQRHAPEPLAARRRRRRAARRPGASSEQ